MDPRLLSYQASSLSNGNIQCPQETTKVKIMLTNRYSLEHTECQIAELKYPSKSLPLPSPETSRSDQPWSKNWHSNIGRRALGTCSSLPMVTKFGETMWSIFFPDLRNSSSRLQLLLRSFRCYRKELSIPKLPDTKGENSETSILIEVLWSV
jgi:hypothetical protein